VGCFDIKGLVLAVPVDQVQAELAVPVDQVQVELAVPVDQVQAEPVERVITQTLQLIMKGKGALPAMDSRVT
tara:strand:- start:1080 stop:1295 length:216 start_codon:yes stop_codon:yes gene_type:complete